MGLYSGGLIIGRIFASEIWGGGGLFIGVLSNDLIILILKRYIYLKKKKRYRPNLIDCEIDSQIQ